MLCSPLALVPSPPKTRAGNCLTRACACLSNERSARPGRGGYCAVAPGSTSIAPTTTATTVHGVTTAATPCRASVPPCSASQRAAGHRVPVHTTMHVAQSVCPKSRSTTRGRAPAPALPNGLPLARMSKPATGCCATAAATHAPTTAATTAALISTSLSPALTSPRRALAGLNTRVRPAGVRLRLLHLPRRHAF